MIRFGPSGNSDAFYEQGYTSTVQMPKWLSEMGLDAFEYSFGRGVRLKQDLAKRIEIEARRFGIRLSVHMPYFINLAVGEEEKRQKNFGYFIESLRVAKALGATRAVFHPGSAGENRRDALLNAELLLLRVIAAVDEAGYGDITLCPETMGKLNQLGSLAEVISLCNLDDRLIPTIDFGHLHSRSLGGIKTKEDYVAILDALEDGIGKERASRMHVHYSRIEFTKGGEKRHHRIADEQYGPEFGPLAELFFERKMEPTVICESRGTMAEDAKTMKEMYLSAKSGAEKPC